MISAAQARQRQKERTALVESEDYARASKELADRAERAIFEQMELNAIYESRAGIKLARNGANQRAWHDFQLRLIELGFDTIRLDDDTVAVHWCKE